MKENTVMGRHGKISRKQNEKKKKNVEQINRRGSWVSKKMNGIEPQRQA